MWDDKAEKYVVDAEAEAEHLFTKEHITEYCLMFFLKRDGNTTARDPIGRESMRQMQKGLTEKWFDQRLGSAFAPCMENEISLPCWTSNPQLMMGIANAKKDRAANNRATFKKMFPAMLSAVKSQDVERAGRLCYLHAELLRHDAYKCWYDTVQVPLPSFLFHLSLSILSCLKFLLLLPLLPSFTSIPFLSCRPLSTPLPPPAV